MTKYKIGRCKTTMGSDANITYIGPSVLVGYWIGSLHKRENIAVWDHEGKSLLPREHGDLAPLPKLKKKYYVYTVSYRGKVCGCYLTHNLRDVYRECNMHTRKLIHTGEYEVED